MNSESMLLTLVFLIMMIIDDIRGSNRFKTTISSQNIKPRKVFALVLTIF